MEYFKYEIYSDQWVIYLAEDDDHVVAEEDNAAITDSSSKEIHFRRSDLTLKVVMHELWHVFFSYCYLSDTTNMTLEDIEEVSAALFSDRAEKIVEIGKDIYNKLVEIRDAKQT